MNLDQYRRREDRHVTVGVAGVCALGFAGAVVPVIERGVTIAVIIFSAVAAVGIAGRWGARVLRERREDRADALTAAAWRAAHLPAGRDKRCNHGAPRGGRDED